MQWTLVIPLKPLARAKSRLAAATGDSLRPGLALAFAQDTVAAALACPAVRDVAVVTDDALARGASWRRWAPASCPTSPGAGSTPLWRTGRGAGARRTARGAPSRP